MPIRKYRSAAEMNKPSWHPRGSAELHAAIRRVWAFGRRTSKRRFTPGVRRFRSIEEMKRSSSASSDL
jgi:hypothetical protein